MSESTKGRLTDEQIEAIWREVNTPARDGRPLLNFARAILAQTPEGAQPPDSPSELPGYNDGWNAAMQSVHQVAAVAESPEAADVALPPMPAPSVESFQSYPTGPRAIWTYTGTQMDEYARSAIAAAGLSASARSDGQQGVGGVAQDRIDASTERMVEPPTLADVLDALNVFNAGEIIDHDGGREQWTDVDFIAVTALPAFIHNVGRAWYVARAPATGQGDRIDAERWRFVRDFVGEYVVCEVDREGDNNRILTGAKADACVDAARKAK